MSKQDGDDRSRSSGQGRSKSQHRSARDGKGAGHAAPSTPTRASAVGASQELSDDCLISACLDAEKGMARKETCDLVGEVPKWGEGIHDPWPKSGPASVATAAPAPGIPSGAQRTAAAIRLNQSADWPSQPPDAAVAAPGTGSLPHRVAKSSASASSGPAQPAVPTVATAVQKIENNENRRHQETETRPTNKKAKNGERDDDEPMHPGQGSDSFVPPSSSQVQRAHNDGNVVGEGVHRNRTTPPGTPMQSPRSPRNLDSVFSRAAPPGLDAPRARSLPNSPARLGAPPAADDPYVKRSDLDSLFAAFREDTTAAMADTVGEMRRRLEGSIESTLRKYDKGISGDRNARRSASSC